jgi:ATP:corrinoid adenosyltransferase
MSELSANTETEVRDIKHAYLAGIRARAETAAP